MTITLADLKPVPVMMRVTTPYGRVVEMQVVPLTWHEWNTIGAQVLDPVKENRKFWTRINADGEKEFNPDDVGYRAALDEANSKRSYRRLLVALEKGGNSIEGDTVEEQIANLAEIEVGIAVALINKLGEISLMGRASVFTLAESFETNEYLRQVAMVCHRKGWTLSQWERLPDSEKDFWLAWELYQERQAEAWWQEFTSVRDDEGKKAAWFAPEVVRGMIEMAKAGL